MKKQRRRGWTFVKILLIAVALGVLFLCFVLGRLLILENQVSRDPSELRESYDAIIVLGAQVKADGTPSVQLSWRLDAAAEAYRNRPVPILVCGAQGADEPMPEAVAMRDVLAENGIPDEMILMDPDSRDTRQNLTNAKTLLSRMENVRKVLVVSSDYHVPRALALAGDMGFEAVGLGAPCKPEYWIKNHARETLAWIKYWMQKYLLRK